MQHPTSTTRVGLGGLRRPGRRGSILILLGAVAWPFLEIWLLTLLADGIGLWPTVGVVVATAVLGAVLLVTQGGRSWRAAVTELTQGRTPEKHLWDGALILAGGIALLLPGLLTDLIGLLLVLPPTRSLVRRVVSGRGPQAPDRPDVIPGTAEEAPEGGQDAAVVGRLLP